MNVMNIIPEAKQLFDKNGRPRVGNYMHTATGEKYWPFDPRPEEIRIETIAHHLSTQGRYQGATQHPADPSRIAYFVSEHSVYVARYVHDVLERPDLALEALLHDAAEFSIGDLIRPVKYNPAFEAYFPLEKLNEEAIAKRFNLLYPFPKEIKIADEAVTAAECDQIIVRDESEEWSSAPLHDRSHIADVKIEMMLPIEAKQFFLREYFAIMVTRDLFREVPADLQL